MYIYIYYLLSTASNGVRLFVLLLSYGHNLIHAIFSLVVQERKSSYIIQDYTLF